MRGGVCLILLLGLSCLLLLVPAGPAPHPDRRRRRRAEQELGKEVEEKVGGDLQLEGSGGAHLGDPGGGLGLGEGSGEGRGVGRRRGGVKESRGTYFFCELYLYHHHKIHHRTN